MSVDADAIVGEIARAEERLTDVRKQRDSVQERIGGIRKELDAMDGGRVAADAAAEAEEALSKSGPMWNATSGSKLAALLLGCRNGALQAEEPGTGSGRGAGEMFSCITMGACAGLTSGFSTGDEVVLMCLRDDGAEVPVEGLSDGTRDQLYLALRLASLERHVERNEPPPLILDDVLINFDDDRAAATMGLLGELSAKTQVLFFTHHRRMLEIARAAVPADRLMEHNLDLYEEGEGHTLIVAIGSPERRGVCAENLAAATPVSMRKTIYKSMVDDTKMWNPERQT
ncbi:MAG: hypothetical protein MZV70_65860 [Desulfobacterales bacterium]|nr:hypothetical protein [Desulfobacterales bacterium]